MAAAHNHISQLQHENRDGVKPCVQEGRHKVHHDDRDHWLSDRSSDFLPVPRKSDETFEPLDMTTVSLRHPGGHQPGRIVESIHYLLCNGGSSGESALRPWSCELPRRPYSLHSECTSLLPIPSRRSLGSVRSQEPLPQHPCGQSTPSLAQQASRQSFGCMSLPCPPSPPDALPVPRLSWRNLVGCGSSARVYRGVFNGKEVAVKVLVSGGSEATFTGDLFESLVSANMHHPNVVGTYEVLTVEQPSAPLEASHSICRHSSRSDMAKERHAPLGPLSPLREAPELDSLISFYERQRVSNQLPQEPVLAACNPLCPAGTSAFAANCGALAAAEDNTSESNDGERHGSQPVLGNEPRGMLGPDGIFKASRASSTPLPLSPFDAAVSQANIEPSSGGDSGGGCGGSAAAHALISMQRHSADGGVGNYEVLTVEQPSAPLEASHSIHRHSSRSDVAKERHARPGPLSPLREAPELDSLISFYERQRVSDRSPQEPVLAACKPLCPAGTSAFAAANCGALAAAKNRSESNDGDRHGSRPVLGNEPRGMLGPDGVFRALRASSTPLPLSPFDAAVSRAEVEPGRGGNSGSGCGGSAAAHALVSMQRRSFDGAARPTAAERGFCADGPGSVGGSSTGPSSSWSRSSSAGPSSSWSRSSSSCSGGTDGGSHLSARSPLPDLPQPQPPRSSQVLIVMELADQRSLHHAIAKGRLADNMEAILLCAMDVAAGMGYLHSMGVIHADLKPANVLLMSTPVTAEDPRGFTCKIADFGLARLLVSGSSHADTDKLGSLPYLAPEVLQRGEVAKPADVYSFAVLLLELWCGRVAYAGENAHGVLYSAFCGRRPRVPADTPAAYRALLQSCWAVDPQARPSFEAAHAELASLMAAARSGHGDVCPN